MEHSVLLQLFRLLLQDLRKVLLLLLFDLFVELLHLDVLFMQLPLDFVDMLLPVGQRFFLGLVDGFELLDLAELLRELPEEALLEALLVPGDGIFDGFVVELVLVDDLRLGDFDGLLR